MGIKYKGEQKAKSNYTLNRTLQNIEGNPLTEKEEIKLVYNYLIVAL